jgi:hypothetical protein
VNQARAISAHPIRGALDCAGARKRPSIGADGGTRTRTGFPPRDFKSLASTISPRPRMRTNTPRPRGCAQINTSADADNYMMSAKSGNHTGPVKAISPEADNYTISRRVALQVTLNSYCGCCADCFFFCTEAFCMEPETFCPEAAGACRTSAQGSGAF